ncbi:hypothetical protein B0T16DRAFT_392232 [Cercophora newfieldiana]|uniref:Uncharacterized protein n=1 Tax=Cercophora newfieldiana TaxID=92897 RepID=A0AA40CMA3_9PEZI|nr:hypothetical protein B0T16DRAFT_392232 [Cercophora newfieldiana]
MASPPASATTRITQITDLLGSRRTRIASLRLLSLNGNFLDDIAAMGDLSTLAEIGCLFQCLMDIPYLCGFSKPVDRAIAKLLLHATKGCEVRLARLRSQRSHDSLYWQLPSEVETKEILEIYRSFLHYITCQHCSSSPVKDPSLMEAKRKLHKLCPRINNLSRWSPSPIREVSGHSWTDSPATRPKSNSATPSGSTMSATPKSTTKIPALAPVPKHDGKANPQGNLLATPPDTMTPACEAHLTVPTLRLSREPNLRVSAPRRSQRKYTARLRVVNGMVEEVTQPFSSPHDENGLTESRDAKIKAGAQLDREIFLIFTTLTS